MVVAKGQLPRTHLVVTGVKKSVLEQSWPTVLSRGKSTMTPWGVTSKAEEARRMSEVAEAAPQAII